MGLLERDVPLLELQRAWDEATSGAGRIALVSGEAGVGKTSLVRRFLRECSNSTTILWGACDALFTPRPLGPLYDMAESASGPLATLLAGDAPRSQILSTFLGELRARPTIAVFEDVHWADEATLDLLRFVGRRIADSCSFLITTYREDELTPGHPWRNVLGDLSSSGVTRRVALQPLSESAVGALVRDTSIDAAALFRQTAGNPFFVTEVIAAGGGLPETVRDAVLARAARLSSSARSFLQVSAVLGQRTELPVLLRVATQDTAASPDPLTALDENLRAGMLVANGDQVSFRHELARRAILDEIPRYRRAELNRRALVALVAEGDSLTDPARLAHHADEAGDQAAILRHAPTAARQAAIAGAHRNAADLYEVALRHAVALPAREHAELLEAYAQECNLVDRRAEGAAVCLQAADLWRDLGEPVRQGNMLAILANMLIGVGRSAEAAKHLAEAVDLLESNPPGAQLAYAYRMVSSLQFLDHSYEAALVSAEQSMAVSEALGDTGASLSAHNLIGSCLLFIDYDRGCRYLEENLARARPLGLTSVTGHAYTNLASASCELYQLKRAEQYLREGLAYAVENDLDRYRLYMTGWAAMNFLRLGQWDQVEGPAQQVLGLEGVSIPSRITALSALGALRARRGEADAAVLLDEALELARGLSNLHRIGLVRMVRAEAAWLAGDRPRAVEEASAAHELAVAKRHPWFAGELAYWLWRCGVAVEAADWLAEPYRLSLSGEWREAAAAWSALDCPYEAARALADGDVAAQLQALDTFETLGAQAATEAVRRSLREAGVSGIPRGPRPTTRDNPYQLTARQMEILRLLADGLSNAAIAGRLHLAPKTVDHHVSAVLGKLDVHSREAAAEVARDTGLV